MLQKESNQGDLWKKIIPPFFRRRNKFKEIPEQRYLRLIKDLVRNTGIALRNPYLDINNPNESEYLLIRPMQDLGDETGIANNDLPIITRMFLARITKLQRANISPEQFQNANTLERNYAKTFIDSADLVVKRYPGVDRNQCISWIEALVNFGQYMGSLFSEAVEVPKAEHPSQFLYLQDKFVQGVTQINTLRERLSVPKGNEQGEIAGKIIWTNGVARL